MAMVSVMDSQKWVWGVVLILASCTPEAGVDPGLAGTVTLVLAGAPNVLFGTEAEPTFEATFRTLSDAGFDGFFPFFATRENATGNGITRHFEYFFPPGALGPDTYDCARSNPYVAAREAGVGIVFPAFFVAGDPVAPFDRSAFDATWSLLRTGCWGGDDSYLMAVQNFDEPASNAVATAYATPSTPFRMENVTALSAALRAQTRVPVVTVEAPLPLAFEIDPSLIALPAEEKARLIATYWEHVSTGTAAADWFGFDVYPVGTPASLASSGEYVGVARERHRGTTVAVLQGFGLDDLRDGRSGVAPTAAEQRFLALHAIIRGARVLVWWGASMTDPEGPGWAALRETSAFVSRLNATLLHPSVPAPVSGEDIEALAVRAEASTFVWFVHAADQVGQLTLAVPGSGPFVVRDVRTMEVVASGDATSSRTVIVPVTAWDARVLELGSP